MNFFGGFRLSTWLSLPLTHKAYKSSVTRIQNEIEAVMAEREVVEPEQGLSPEVINRLQQRIKQERSLLVFPDWDRNRQRIVGGTPLVIGSDLTLSSP